jgi:hypothetical protein
MISKLKTLALTTMLALAATVGALVPQPVKAFANECRAAIVLQVYDLKQYIGWQLDRLAYRMGIVVYLDTAFQNQYRQEFVEGFEQKQTLLRPTVTTEAVIKGNQAIFQVADSGQAIAVTRGVNGMIPARSDNLNQFTALLGEWHDLVRKTNFNIFASQGNQRAIMQMTTMGVINRKVDDQIITELNTGTVTIGSAAVVGSINLVMNAGVKLQNASVPWDSRITFLCNPAFLAYLEQAPEFSNAQYCDPRTFAPMANSAMWRDMPPAYRWKNMLVISHPGLPGKGTTSEKNFMYHQSAIGHAADTAGVESPVGYNEEQNYSWARCTMFMGAKLLQNSGVVVITADGSAYA